MDLQLAIEPVVADAAGEGDDAIRRDRLEGAVTIAELDLERAYESRVDPRLNYEQALEMTLLIARRMASLNGTR